MKNKFFVLFLDIDGVLVKLNKSKNKRSNNYFPYSIEFSKEAVKILNRIVNYYKDIKVVISSSWGQMLSPETIFITLNSHGFSGPYVLPEDVGEEDNKFKGNRLNWLNNCEELTNISITPKQINSKKKDEIGFWLSDYKEYIKGCLIIDDKEVFNKDSDLEKYQLVVDESKCLQESDFKKAIDILNLGFNN
jgi:hypothetical protein